MNEVFFYSSHSTMIDYWPLQKWRGVHILSKGLSMGKLIGEILFFERRKNIGIGKVDSLELEPFTFFSSYFKNNSRIKSYFAG
jgi:hypothetical protein